MPKPAAESTRSASVARRSLASGPIHSQAGPRSVRVPQIPAEGSRWVRCLRLRKSSSDRLSVCGHGAPPDLDHLPANVDCARWTSGPVRETGRIARLPLALLGRPERTSVDSLNGIKHILQTRGQGGTVVATKWPDIEPRVHADYESQCPIAIEDLARGRGTACSR